MGKPDFELPPDMDWWPFSIPYGWVIHFRYGGEDFWYHSKEWNEHLVAEATLHLRQRAYLKRGVPPPPDAYLLNGELVETISPGYELRVVWDRGWWTSLVHINEYGDEINQDEIWMEDLKEARARLDEIRQNVRLHSYISRRWNTVMRK